MSVRLRQLNVSGGTALIACLIAWEVLARANPGFEAHFPPVSRVLTTLIQLVTSGEILPDVLATLSRYGRGYALAAALAVSLGVILGSSRFLLSLVATPIEFLRPMPSVATIPIAILFLGIGDSMKIAVATYGATWPILLNTIDGVRRIDPTLIATGQTLGLGRGQIVWKIALPAALPYIVTGLRISLPIALIAITATVMLGGSNGLGFFILDVQRAMKISDMYAGIILVSLIGYALNRLFVLVEARAMAWHRSARARDAA